MISTAIKLVRNWKAERYGLFASQEHRQGRKCVIDSSENAETFLRQYSPAGRSL